MTLSDYHLTPIDYISIFGTAVGFIGFVIQLALLTQEQRITLARASRWLAFHVVLLGSALGIFFISRSWPAHRDAPTASRDLLHIPYSEFSTKDALGFAIVYVIVAFASAKRLRKATDEDPPLQ
jgi:hypothetical protein